MTFFVFAANDPHVKDQLPTQSRVELLRKSGISRLAARTCSKRKNVGDVLKAGKAGRGGPHIYTDPKTKTTIHCVSKEEKDARGNVYTAWLKVENDCNLFQDHWVVFVDKLQLEKAEERESKKREILSRADPVRYSAAMKEKVQHFLHLKVGEENVESAWRGDHSKLVVNDKEGRELFTSAAKARRAELDQQGHQRFKLEGLELQTLVDKFRAPNQEATVDKSYQSLYKDLMLSPKLSPNRARSISQLGKRRKQHLDHPDEPDLLQPLAAYTMLTNQASDDCDLQTPTKKQKAMMQQPAAPSKTPTTSAVDQVKKRT
eukprot:g27718.t1